MALSTHVRCPALPRSRALAGQVEGKIMQFGRRFAGDPQDIPDFVVIHHETAVVGRSGIEQSLGGFAQDHQVDPGSARVGKSLRGIWIGLYRAHPRIEPEPVAQAKVRGDLGAVLVADRRQSDRAEEHGIRPFRAFFPTGLDILARFLEISRTGQDFHHKSAPVRQRPPEPPRRWPWLLRRHRLQYRHL